ncbi:MAG: glutaredoxin domain-containing protein [Flavobacteriaceae bacterium]
MKHIIRITILLFSLSLFSQKHIKIETVIKKNATLFYVVNNSNVKQKIHLKITSNYFNKGYKVIVKKVKPNSRKKFYKLKSREDITYSVAITSKSSKKKKLRKASKSNIKKFDFKKDDINKGIVIFTKKTCSRCKIAENYLLKHNIPFKIISTTETTTGRTLMWEKIAEKSTQITNVTMPVIIIDGDLSYSHANLNMFLNALKK